MTDLSSSAERHLHDTDRPAWLAYVAPRMAVRLSEMADVPDATLADTWGFLSRDYQRAVWPLLDDAMRDRIRAARKALLASDGHTMLPPTHLPIPNCPQPDQGNAGEAAA